MYAILYTTKNSVGDVMPRVFSTVDDIDDAVYIVDFLNDNPGRHFNGGVEENAGNYCYCCIPDMENQPKFTRAKQTQNMIQAIKIFRDES